TSVYDNANQLTSRKLGGSGATEARADLNYTTRGELAGVTRYSNVSGATLAGTTSYAYDDASRVTAITDKSSTAATIAYQNYQFDAADRVTQEDWSSTTATTTFTGTHTY